MAMDKVHEASIDSFPASDPPAFVAGKDPYFRPDLPLKERREMRAAEGLVAMADYRRTEQHSRNNLTKLRMERLERGRAVNKPVEDNARKGAVRKRTKPKLRRLDKSKQRDGRVLDVKKTKSVRRGKEAA